MVGYFHLQRLRDDGQFRVRHAPETRFDFGHARPAQLQAEDLQPGGKLLLCQAALHPQLPDHRPDSILLFGHAPILELDRRAFWLENCSNIGAK